MLTSSNDAIFCNYNNHCKNYFPDKSFSLQIVRLLIKCPNTQAILKKKIIKKMGTIKFLGLKWKKIKTFE